MESRHCGKGQKNILLSCPQCLDSMLAPGFWNKVYRVHVYHNATAIQQQSSLACYHLLTNVPRVPFGSSMDYDNLF